MDQCRRGKPGMPESAPGLERLLVAECHNEQVVRMAMNYGSSLYSRLRGAEVD